MKTAQFATLVGAAVSFLGQPTANACGDKLSMMGGGVSFETLNPSLHQGRVVLFITPESSLHVSSAGQGLKKTLERAGHQVRSVDSAASMQSALRSGDIDIVLTNLGDNAAVPVPTSARAPAMLSVVYKPTADAFSGSSVTPTCTARADKARGRQMLEAIENVLAHKGRGLGPNCAPASVTKST
jgi:hypothetical protein